MKQHLRDIQVVVESDLQTLPPGLYRLPDAKRDFMFIATTNEMMYGDMAHIARICPAEKDMRGLEAIFTTREDGATVIKQWVGDEILATCVFDHEKYATITGLQEDLQRMAIAAGKI